MPREVREGDISRMKRTLPGGSERREFLLRGLSRVLGYVGEAATSRLAPDVHIRPPGALPEAAFVAACTRCGACVSACPATAITRLPEMSGLATGTPVLRPNEMACVMCADMPCAAACPTEALSVPEGGWLDVRMGVAVVDVERCLPYRDVTCGVCARVCPVGAQALSLDVAGRPTVGAACTGCGACVTACVTAPSSMSIRVAREVA